MPSLSSAVYSLAGVHPQCAITRAIALESKSKREAASKGRTLSAVCHSGQRPGDLHDRHILVNEIGGREKHTSSCQPEKLAHLVISFSKNIRYTSIGWSDD